MSYLIRLLKDQEVLQQSHLVMDNIYLVYLGNPSACFTGFELYVKPAVNKLIGASECYPQTIKATLMEDFTKPNPFTRFIRAKATLTPSGTTVVPSGFNKSGAVVAIAHANAMILCYLVEHEDSKQAHGGCNTYRIQCV